MSDKSGFSKGKKYITVCDDGYTRSDISDGYLARAQNAEKIIGDKGTLFLTIDPADIDPSKITTGIVQLVNLHKPVVWVREEKRGIWTLCDERGNYIDSDHLWTNSLDTWRLIQCIEIKVWKEPEPEPVEWVYAVWKCKSSNYFVRSIKGCHPKSPMCIQDVEYGVKKLLEGEADKHHPFPSKDVPPSFGVRKLTFGEGESWEEYCACRDGKRILWCNGKTPEECIEKVIEQLIPATDAVTLDDLKTA